MKRFFYKNSFQFGTLLGLFLPIISYIIFEGIDKLIYAFYKHKIVFTNVIPDDTQMVLAIGINLFTFRYYMVKQHLDHTGKGILFVTFLYALMYIIVFHVMKIQQVLIFS